MAMSSREAKDFLVSEIMRQAAIEHVPVTDIERRMMYFTEQADYVEDPIELNTAFEAECDSAVYEKKITDLARRACQRLKVDSPRSAAWDEAIQTLEQGDHYLLVMCGGSSVVGTIPVKVLATFAARLLLPLSIVAVALWLLKNYLGPTAHIGWILFYGCIALVTAISWLRFFRPELFKELSQRTMFAVAKYLFGRNDRDKAV